MIEFSFDMIQSSVLPCLCVYLHVVKVVYAHNFNQAFPIQVVHSIPRYIHITKYNGSSCCWSRVVKCSVNSSQEDSNWNFMFVELGGLYISEKMFVLDLIFTCTVSSSKDSYFCDFGA